jgi:ubiquinone/menaquinone biosynthesis C-methylase UbiE
MNISDIEAKEVTEREIHKEDKIILNYTGVFHSFGDILEDGTIIDHGRLWEYLTRYRMMMKLANIPDVNGNCVLRKDSIKYDRALELGCDWGHCFEAIGAGFKEVFGVEVMQSSVDLGINYGRSIKHGLIEEIPYKDDYFDIVISNHVLEHSSGIEKTVKEIERVTKSGGWGLHTLPLDLDGSNLVVGGFHQVGLSNTEFVKLFTNNGFNLINTFWFWNHDKEDFTFIVRKDKGQ